MWPSRQPIGGLSDTTPATALAGVLASSVAMAVPFLNVDAGELPDEPEELYRAADVANIACGGHAGNDATILRSVDRCIAHHTAVGAHPSYADVAHFGRVSVPMTEEELRCLVRDQCERLRGWTTARNRQVTHAKAHGALYHNIDRIPSLAEAYMRGLRAALGPNVVVIGPRNGATEVSAKAMGFEFASEGFADRRRTADGKLVPRTEPNALIENEDEAARVALALASEVDTVCVHSDTRNAVQIALRVRRELDALKATA